MVTNTAQPVLLLTCIVCEWRPEAESDKALKAKIVEHYDTEHEGAPSAMRLVAYCPRHDVPLVHRMTSVVRSTGRNVTTYDCSVDLRSYRVKWSPGDL